MTLIHFSFHAKLSNFFELRTYHSMKMEIYAELKFA